MDKGKSKARYLIRFDDLCPQMDWNIWNKIEKILFKYNIKPIIAVVPDNQDPYLNIGNPSSSFWEKIYEYQQLGYMVALHGYNHVYINHDSGLMGISANSEFAGQPEAIQRRKIEKGCSIFREHYIKVDAFIAPSHSFDNTTLKILKENNINIISDGHLNYVYEDKGFVWIPCQLWDRIPNKQSGIYTVCIHPNQWCDKDIEYFEQDIINNLNNISAPFDIIHIKKINMYGKFVNSKVKNTFKIKRFIKKFIK